MFPRLDTVTTVIAFALVIIAGTAGLWYLPIGMTQQTILTMVLPSMIVFGAIMLVIGLSHGKYRFGA